MTVTAALALTTGVAACSGSSGGAALSSKPAKTFTYWTSGWTPQQITTIDTAFEKAYPGIKAQGQYIASSDQYLPKVIAAIKSNTQPTVLLDQNPSDLPLLAESGKLIPLTGKLTSLTDQLFPGIKNSLFYRGQQLGMAFAGEGDLVLFYNKKAFAAAGISSPPKTWPQLEADAIKLSDPKQNRYGFYVPLGDAEFISYAWETLLWADGGQLLNADQTKAAFDSPAGVKALTTWVDLVRKDKAAPAQSYAQAGNFDGAPAFASNAVAMLIDGQWDVSAFQKDKIDFGVAPLPSGDVGPSTNIGIGVMALLKTSSAQDTAGLDFIKFLASPQEGAYLAVQSGGLPSAPQQSDEPLLKNYIAKTPFYNVFAESEKTGQVRPITPAYNAVSEALWTQINAAIEGKVTPSQALATAARQADSALKNQS
jgi:multiple sugar transport system substrate-binding protein